MAPPKRALFSLNLESDVDHVCQKVEDHNEAGTKTVKILESKGPTHNHTDLTCITRPFERVVDSAVDEVVEGSGRRIKSKEGEVTYLNSTTTETTRSNSSSKRGNLNVVSKQKRRTIERKYDTSEL